MSILYLGSTSASRQMLLQEAQIPFQCVTQTADETLCDWALPLKQLVEKIALYKMEHVILPLGNEGERRFVLTADTLSQDMDGTIHGKPKDRQDAIDKIRRARAGSRLCTAFCLDVRNYQSSVWYIEKRICVAVSAEYIFDVPEEWVEIYLEKSMGLHASNAIAIEGFGGQFLKSVHGSYTTIVGLPMFEVRQALEEVDFFRS